MQFRRPHRITDEGDGKGEAFAKGMRSFLDQPGAARAQELAVKASEDLDARTVLRRIGGQGKTSSAGRAGRASAAAMYPTASASSFEAKKQSPAAASMPGLVSPR